MSYQNSLLFRYLDTFPRSAGHPGMAGVDPRAHAAEQIDERIRRATTPYGTPDEVAVAIADSTRTRASTRSCSGCCRRRWTRDLAIETIETFGTHVLPQFDTDPVHRTTRQRERPRACLASREVAASSRPCRAPTFNLADLWETLCDAGPDAECLVAPPVRHTRGSLDAAANQIANHLRRVGRRSPATASASTRATVPSTSRRCSAAGSAARCRSTSTGATSRPSCGT